MTPKALISGGNMTERQEFMRNWEYTNMDAKGAYFPLENMEVWHVYLDGAHFEDYFFPESENLTLLLQEVTEDAEFGGRKVSSHYLQPDYHEIQLYTSSHLLSDDEEMWWTL
jgi:hypothetical protein